MVRAPEGTTTNFLWTKFEASLPPVLPANIRQVRPHAEDTGAIDERGSEELRKGSIDLSGGTFFFLFMFLADRVTQHQEQQSIQLERTDAVCIRGEQ